MAKTINIIQLDHAQGLPLPSYKTAGAAGADICAALPDAPVEVAPLKRVLVPTGLILCLPKNTEAQIRPRSGLAFHYGMTLINSPATIDSDYRGEIKLLMVNLGDEIFKIEHGMRIAQLVIADVVQGDFELTDRLEDTDRGESGFGSTGLKDKSL